MDKEKTDWKIEKGEHPEMLLVPPFPIPITVHFPASASARRVLPSAVYDKGKNSPGGCMNKPWPVEALRAGWQQGTEQPPLVTPSHAVPGPQEGFTS
ncbi:hypothetical protein NHX12_022715, partial [Muraenolepis orangiensis]